jgi:hypothetical protein
VVDDWENLGPSNPEVWDDPHRNGLRWGTTQRKALQWPQGTTTCCRGAYLSIFNEKICVDSYL